jgi:hypothetical protein
MSLARRLVTPRAAASWSSGTPYISAASSSPAASAAVTPPPSANGRAAGRRPGADPGAVTLLFHHAPGKWRPAARKSGPVLVPVRAVGHNVCST